MKWLYKLEYKFGRYYIPRLMLLVVIGMVIVFLGSMVMPGLTSMLAFSAAHILRGQVWRLVTFVFVPASSGIWLLIYLYFYYFIGTALENMWGGFRMTLYYLIGILGTIAAGFLSYALGYFGVVPTASPEIMGYMSNEWLNLSLILAFATLAPDTQFRLFFILPIKASWLAIAYAVLLGLGVVTSFIGSVGQGVSQLVGVVFSFANYLLFFGRDMVETIRNKIRIFNNRRNWNRRNR